MPNTTYRPTTPNRWRIGQKTLRLATAAALIICLLTTISPQASADHCDSSGSIDREGGEASYSCHLNDAGRDGSGESTLTAEQQWESYCRYLTDTGGGLPYLAPANVTFLYQGTLDQDRVTALNFDPTGTYGSFIAECNHPLAGGSGTGGEFFYNIVAPVSLVDLRAEAKARINIADPAIDTNPSFTDRFTLVNIDTWLWANPAYWVDKYETETAGFVTVEVFATPTTMTWDFSDGTTTTCNGPGRAWVRGAINPPCSVVFTRSSAGQPNNAYQGTTTVSWVFSWAVNGTDQGEFDTPFLATTNFELQVGEIQSVSS